MLSTCLASGDDILTGHPLTRAARALERFLPASSEPTLLLSPDDARPRQAARWLERSGGALDGVIAKRLDEPYRSGERAMLKVKRQRTADCVVGGFRYDRAGGGRFAAARPL